MVNETEKGQVNNAPLSATEMLRRTESLLLKFKRTLMCLCCVGIEIIIDDGYILSNAYAVFDKKSERGVLYAVNEILCKQSSQNVYELDLIYVNIKKYVVRCIPISYLQMALLFVQKRWKKSETFIP